ncbi:WD domain, G-beta repeat-containing protein [Cardiosporidium cionae]|uniref:WD domain, G-beta repeat-containing protein n=1 Tax=Cardiosporidium cionae TaxID=476202 RepID=A0ABQ7J638_9APIC|nr:WD domain, G-beta repeat-containing protein [Cardiosporidium cionae]|eukprot:KAF8819462.1 WD domain, G-beta repeat-containing protein [Cardiosporidium cionae]
MSRSRDFTRKRKVSEDLQTTSIHTLAASQQSVNSTSSSSSDPLSRHASSSTSADVSNSVFIASTHPSPEILTTGASSVLPSYLRPTLQLSVFPLEGIASSAVHTPQGVSQGSSEGEEGTRLPFRALPVTSLTEEEGEKIVCETFSSCKRQRMDISSEIPSAYSRSSSSVNGINGLTRRSNGDAFCNRDDVSSPFPFIPSISPLERWEGLPRRELILLILQCLDGLGYKQTSRMLESESGVPLELPPITHLRQAILTGDWLDVFKILLQLSLEESVIQAMKFLVIEQKFLELMYHQHIEEAVECLRGEFQDACFDTETSNRLKSCCSFLMCQNSEDLQKRSHWSYEGSRTILLSRLQQLFPPDLVPPPKRLNSLLKQAWKYQELHCLYHTHSVDKKYPLLLDHECPKGGVPKHKISVLDRHTDEVWDVAVSNSAKYIASASKDRTIILWDACPPYKKVENLDISL